jgi:hypothetical protein
MRPVEQTCPKCQGRFLGSDVIGFPCEPCLQLDPKSFAEAIATMNQMYYQEKEND